MALYDFAKSELDRIYDKESLKGKDNPNKWMYRDILQIVKLFSKQGHSGASAHYCIEVLNKLLRFHPLGELTNNPEEWMEYTEGEFQSRRRSSCFSIDGIKNYYDIDSKRLPKLKRLFIKNINGYKLIKLEEKNAK